MKLNLSRQREILSLFLSVCVMTLLSLNFVENHTIGKAYELRFLLSGSLLAMLTMYLRFIPPVVNHLVKALYRLAAVMSFWSFGFFVFPAPDFILYLISFPAFYFLFRIEIKQEIQTEDLIAGGFLLALGTFLYIQQQPLKILLFDQREFLSYDYYRNAPLLILFGIGFMRLHKHSQWRGLSLLGTLLFLSGLVLTGSLLIPGFTHGEIFCAIVLIHVFMIVLWVKKSPVPDIFKHFCGMDDDGLHRLVMSVWVISVLFLHISVIYLFLLFTSDIRVVFLSLAALFPSLYMFRRVTTTILMMEWMILFWIGGLFVIPAAGFIWQIPSALILVVCVFFRRKKTWAYLIPNKSILLLVVLYFIQYASQLSLDDLSYTGLLFALIPLACWMMIPDRPLSIGKRYHWMAWPFITAIFVLFIYHGFHPRLLMIWALAVLLPPFLLYVVLSSNLSDTWFTHRYLRFLKSWKKSGKSALFYLTLVSVFAVMSGFALNYQWFIDSWAGIIQAGLVLCTGIIIYLYLAADVRKTSYLMLAEFLIWAGLGLIRWKMDVMGSLHFGTPADGYILIFSAVIAAGLRESIRTRVPEFSSYFQKTTFAYGIIGWVYLQVLQFIHTGHLDNFGYHGELASVLMAMLNFRLSQTIKRSNLIYTFVFANAALLLFFFKQDFTNLLYYVLPAAGSALVLVQLFKDHLAPELATQIRLVISLLICGVSGFYTIIDFNESIWYPVIALLVAGSGVILGISFRIRIYLTMGLVFFIVNSAGVVGHIIMNQPPQNMLGFISLLFLLAGIPLIAAFVILQIKRQQIMERYKQVMDELSQWD